jgi:hypothetical protein
MSRDILALTKMNWNSTQFDGALPIPIRVARQVGKVLKHVRSAAGRRLSIRITSERMPRREGGKVGRGELRADERGVPMPRVTHRVLWAALALKEPK